MSKALCYINRHAPDGPEKLDTRILVINATPGSSEAEAEVEAEHPESSAPNGSSIAVKKPVTTTGAMRGGYVGLMNCVFAAQKAKVPIDVLTLPPKSTGTSPPIFLQQASHLTEGIYWRWNGRGGLLQYLHVSRMRLMSVFAMEGRSRRALTNQIGYLSPPAQSPTKALCRAAAGCGRLSCSMLLPWRCS